MTDDITIKEGHIYGGWRTAVNKGLNSDNIHSDGIVPPENAYAVSMRH